MFEIKIQVGGQGMRSQRGDLDIEVSTNGGKRGGEHDCASGRKVLPEQGGVTKKLVDDS